MIEVLTFNEFTQVVVLTWNNHELTHWDGHYMHVYGEKLIIKLLFKATSFKFKKPNL